MSTKDKPLEQLCMETVIKSTQTKSDVQDTNQIRQELVVGLVGLVGTDLMAVVDELKSTFGDAGHTVNCVSISEDVFPELFPKLKKADFENEFDRIWKLMDAGNNARDNFRDHSILALGAIVEINKKRRDENEPTTPKPLNKTVHIIKSLKHPSEVERLRETYGEGFFLIGVHAEKDSRVAWLTKNNRMQPDQAEELLKRDFRENEKSGQHTSETFHLADLFVSLDESDSRSRLKSSISRFVRILLSDPNCTPDFDEYAMYMAFASSLRSSDPSRQVGAVIGSKDDIIAIGANDTPSPGGGLYMTHHVEDKGLFYFDEPNGRDRELGYDSNEKIKNEIIGRLFDSISPLCDGNDGKLQEILSLSEIKDITEYGRSVHAEMSALLSCARNGISCVGKTLYTTLFTCHNCAKHIIAAGIKRVVYIEPYEKSKAIELHSDAIKLGKEPEDNKVLFEQFIGVGPRRFFDLFSMNHGMGRRLRRKDDDGNIPKWNPQGKSLRFGLTPASYLDQETIASRIYKNLREEVTEKGNNDGK